MIVVAIHPSVATGIVHKNGNHSFAILYKKELSSHVETVVQLSLKTDTPHIDVTMQQGEESNYNPQEKATYQKIKACVKEKHGLNVSSLYIAQTKEKCGLDKRMNYNLAKSEDAKQPKCTPEKEAAIMDAFRYFGLI